MSQDVEGKIVVMIQGGAAADVQFPLGCPFALVIRDYDTDGVDEDALTEDEAGDRCQEFEFSPGEEPDGVTDSSDVIAAKPRIRITFENEPERNGSTTTHSPTLPAAMRTLGEMVNAAIQRPSLTTITVVITPAPSELPQTT